MPTLSPEILEKHEHRRIPRYTSYPTAPHFGSAVDAGTYRTWLGRVPAEAHLSIYLHVPYCAQMCWYCGCHTKITRRYDPISRYVQSLEKEIATVAAALPAGHADARPVRHVHWGGGSPNMVAPDDFERLMAGLAARFGLHEAAEVAVEIDARQFSDVLAVAYGRAGVNRASLGVQSFDPAVQRAINRIQPVETVAAAVARLRGIGVTGLNFDLLYGLPHQTVANAVETTKQAVDLGPDRFAVFGYAHLPTFKKHQRLIDEAWLADGRGRFDQAEAIAETLVAAGYVAIGLDHFARPDDPMAVALADGALRRNFQGYTTDPADALIGLGASSIGALPQGYVQNAIDIGAWMKAADSGALAVVKGLALDADDRLRREVIERLMCDLRVDLAAVARAHGRAEDFAEEKAALAELARDGLVDLDGDVVRVPEHARAMVRTPAACFDRYLGRGPARHAKAV